MNNNYRNRSRSNSEGGDSWGNESKNKINNNTNITEEKVIQPRSSSCTGGRVGCKQITQLKSGESVESVPSVAFLKCAQWLQAAVTNYL